MKLFQKTKKEVNKHQKALNELIRVVGEERVLSAIEDRICYSYDGTKQKVLPDIVVRPGGTNDVSNALKIANKYEVPIYARGAGSGLTGGAVPLKGGIVFDLKNMDRIIEICPEDFVATVEPGVVTKHLQDEVAKLDLFFPPDPSSAAFSTIGGNVAECAGGITGLKYGVTRDYILALEIVLPDGSIINTGMKTLRSFAGYDLTRLFTGSEGTLGIFTKITVKLIPKPGKIQTLAAHFSDKDDAIDAADLIIDNNVLPRTLEFLDQMTINAVRGHTGTDIGEDVKALLLIDIDGTVCDDIPNEVEITSTSSEILPQKSFFGNCSTQYLLSYILPSLRYHIVYIPIIVGNNRIREYVIAILFPITNSDFKIIKIMKETLIILIAIVKMLKILNEYN